MSLLFKSAVKYKTVEIQRLAKDVEEKQDCRFET